MATGNVTPRSNEPRPAVSNPDDLSPRIRLLFQARLIRPKRLWVLGQVDASHTAAADQDAYRPMYPSELAALAFALLNLSLQSKMRQSKARLRSVLLLSTELEVPSATAIFTEPSPSERGLGYGKTPPCGTPIACLNHRITRPKQIAQVRPHAPYQGVFRPFAVALGFNDGVGNINVRHRLPAAPERIAGSAGLVRRCRIV